MKKLMTLMVVLAVGMFVAGGCGDDKKKDKKDGKAKVKKDKDHKDHKDKK